MGFLFFVFGVKKKVNAIFVGITESSDTGNAGMGCEDN